MKLLLNKDSGSVKQNAKIDNFKSFGVILSDIQLLIGILFWVICDLSRHNTCRHHQIGRLSDGRFRNRIDAWFKPFWVYLSFINVMSKLKMHVESKTIHWDAANAQMLTDKKTVRFCLEVLYPFAGSQFRKFMLSCCHFIYLFIFF